MQNEETIDDLQKKVKKLQEELGSVLGEIESLQADTTSNDVTKGSEKPAQDDKEVEQSGAEEGGEEESIPIIGRTGTFDGVFMIADDDKKFQIPPNYASKSQLVVGDRLEIVDVDETGSKYSFKQVRNVKRKEIEGILTKRDNQWAVHTDDGIYYVVAAAVRFHKADVGDVVAVDLPDEDVPLEVEWAAFKEIRKQGLREDFEPRANQYIKKESEAGEDKGNEDDSENDDDTFVSEGDDDSKSEEPSQRDSEIVKSRLSTHKSGPQAKEQMDDYDETVSNDGASEETQKHEEVVGEVRVPHDNAGEASQSGEIDLTEEDLWELR